MPITNCTLEEIAARGDATYEEHLRHNVERTNRDRFLVMNIESQDYEIDDDDLTAATRLLARRPHGVIYGLRIGQAAAYRIGVHRPAGERSAAA